LYDPACFVDDDDLPDSKRQRGADDEDAPASTEGFDEPVSVRAFLLSLRDPAEDDTPVPSRRRKQARKGREASACGPTAAAAAASGAENARVCGKRKFGKLVLADWSAQDHRDAVNYVEARTAARKSASGCRLWDSERYKTAKFRGVHYPSGQVLAFAAHNPALPLVQRLSVAAQCGNPLCLTPECLRLVYNHGRGRASANFQPLTMESLVSLQRQAKNNDRIGMQHTNISHEELSRMHDAEDYAGIKKWLQPAA